MLSRAGTVIRLIEIRRILQERENNLEEPPDNYHLELKKELDQILLDIIGVPADGQHEINQILHKAVNKEIKAETAAVAVHEIFKEYQQKKQTDSNEKNKGNNDVDSGNSRDDSNKTAGNNLEQLYKSGYR